MADVEVPSWSVLVSLMVHGPDIEPTVRGSIRSVDGTDESRGHFGFMHPEGDPDPIFAASGTGSRGDDGASLLRVWRDGPRVRVEEPDGTPNLIVGDGASWSFDKVHEEPLESLRAEVHYGFRGTDLLWRREAAGFLGRDFTHPTGPIGSATFLGRPAWTVELGPPASKPYPMQLVVDAETGLLLQRRNDGFGTVDEWVEVVVGEEFDPGLFSWEGPARKEADEQAARMAGHEADLAARRSWVAANVSPRPLRLELEITLELHWWDDATGAFEASIAEGEGSLTRRLTSDDPWESHGWSEFRYTWSDDRWDWELTMRRMALAPGALEALQHQLGEGR